MGGYVRPQIVEEDVLEIRDGRHPVVEQLLSGERFVPNDVLFEEGERVRIITGPNMSGKSTLIRQVALIVLLAQIGSYVPASAARIGLVTGYSPVSAPRMKSMPANRPSWSRWSKPPIFSTTPPHAVY